MTELFEVKRVEAQELRSFLKAFAFEESPGLRQGFHDGYEVKKMFCHDDPAPIEAAQKFGHEVCNSSFGFAVFRIPPVRKKRSFAYTLSAEIERTIPHLNPYQFELVPKKVRKQYDNFEEIPESALTEVFTVELGTSDHELREIEVQQTYKLAYCGDSIFESTNEEMLYGSSGAFVDIDISESEDESDQHFILEPIKHERLKPADNVITNIGYWAIVDPFKHEFDQGTPYRSAAQQMRSIVHALRTGEVM
jgi:hypothetical protein